MEGQQPPEDIELAKKQAELCELEAQFAEKELQLATLHAELHRFEIQYIRKVGCLYTELDELKAQIAEAIAREHRSDARAQRIAKMARATAKKSASEASQSYLPDASGEQFKPSDTLKGLYRSAAKALHPDLAEDHTDRAHRERAMASINEAYEKGDENRMRVIMEEFVTSPESVKGKGTAAELVRVIRRISLIRRRLAEVANEIQQLQSSSLAVLKRKVDDGLGKGRDKLEEMAIEVQAEIEDAKMRLAHLQQ